MKTLLVIGYVWPEPNSSAAGSHMLSLLKLFKAQNYRVVFSTPSQPTDHMINLESLGIESVEITLNSSCFDKWVAELNPQVVLFDRFMMEEQFAWRVEKACPNALRVLDTEDLQCLRYTRQQALKNNQTFNLDQLNSSDLAKREIAAIYRSDLSLIISSFEMDILQNHFAIDQSLIHHLPFLIEPKQNTDNLPSFNEREHFVAIGNFRHAPNWDSVLYLQQIWPHIRKQLPQAELHIYGAYPTKKATHLNNPKTGFLVKGWAENANRVIQNARVLLAPLRFGAGIKGKLIDAMLNGTPSITTNIGVEGMADGFKWPGIEANNVEAIANAAVKLYQNKIAWEACQNNITPILTRYYNKPQLESSLIKKMEQLCNNLPSHRVDNFIGAMLLHHSMKSTQFMSKWIEEKNKHTENKP